MAIKYQVECDDHRDSIRQMEDKHKQTVKQLQTEVDKLQVNDWRHFRCFQNIILWRAIFPKPSFLPKFLKKIRRCHLIFSFRLDLRLMFEQDIRMQAMIIPRTRRTASAENGVQTWISQKMGILSFTKNIFQFFFVFYFLDFWLIALQRGANPRRTAFI